MTGVFEYPNKTRPAAGAVDAYVEVFFRCTETVPADGSGSMVDAVRGATYKPSNDPGGTLQNIAGTPANSLFPAITNSVPLTAGTWPNFRQRAVILFAYGRLIDPTQLRIPIGKGDGDLGFGTGTGGNISLSCAGRPHVLINSATTTLMTIDTNLGTAWSLPPAGTEIGVALEVQPLAAGSPSIYAKVIDVNGNTFPASGYDAVSGTTYIETVMSYAGAWFSNGDVNPGLNNVTRFEGMAFYGFSVFSFPGALPSRATLDAAYAEMTSDWRGGRKIPPSQFRYLNQIP